MNKKIEAIVSQCMDCQRYLPSQPDQPNIPLMATRPMEVLDSDLFEYDGKHYVVICDRLTGYIWSERLSNQTSASVIKVLSRICREFGYPNVIYSDSGPCYISFEMIDFAKKHGIVLERSSPHYHSTHGVAESHVKIAKRILQKCHGNYNEFLDGLARYRNIPRAGSHKSPAELFFSRQLREPDLAQLPPVLELSKNHEEVLAKKLEVSQKSQSRRQLDPLKIGQRVLLQCPTTSTWREAGTVVAIDPKFERSYEIKRDGRSQTVTRNRVHLRPMPAAAGDNHNAQEAGAKKVQAKRKQAGIAQAGDPGGGGPASSDPPTALRRSQRLRDRMPQQQQQ